MDLSPHHDTLRRLTRTDPDPRVRHRADALLLVARGLSLSASPLEHHDPVWTVADLTDLLGRHGWTVSTATVYRALHAMGYRYRRPRHDLTPRQDAEAVASAKHVLAELQRRGLLPGRDSGWSTWMNVTSTPILTWHRSGNAGAVP
jgi:hypothetical protein